MSTNTSSLFHTWVVDDDHAIRWVLQRALEKQNIHVTVFPGAAEVLDSLDEGMPMPDVLITDVRMAGMNGLDLLAKLHQKNAELPVIVMTAHSDLDSAVAAYQGGAFEYLPKPFDVNTAVSLVKRAAQHIADLRAAAQLPLPKTKIRKLIGEAPAMQEVFRAIGRLSRSNINVLITGESGVGKELVARALHEHSPRHNKPFLAINTAAIPKDLMESEFFGHERGAFTGAQTQRAGRFEQANGGTLFLDEIGDMPFDLQTRLLRVLSEGVFFRVGGTQPVHVDVRIVAATHQNLEKAVQAGKFREDLFHRLNVIRIRIPSLRERREDIPLLLQNFMSSAAQELGTEVKRLRPEVLAHLSQQPWLGNVRQLENACRWLTVMPPGQEVFLADLSEELLGESPESKSGQVTQNVTAPFHGEHVPHTDWQSSLRLWAQTTIAAHPTLSGLLDQATPQFEKILLEVALEKTHGHRQDAARLLGWGRNTLARKCKELDLDGEELEGKAEH